MQRGTVVAIHIGPVVKGPMHAVEEVRAIPGFGLEGDRYHKRAGTFSKKLSPNKEITLIEEEAVQTMAREVPITPAETRRNVLTRGLNLNDLVGQEFTVGEVRLRGLELCHPCGHLERLTGKPVLTGLKNRGGLRAQILSEGVIRVGDEVEQVTEGKGITAFLSK